MIDKINAKLKIPAEELANQGYCGIKLHNVAGKCGVLSIRIRVETIDYFLRRYREDIIKRRRDRFRLSTHGSHSKHSTYIGHSAQRMDLS